MLNLVRIVLRALGLKKNILPEQVFSTYHYQRHDQRRLEHLASLRLDLSGCKVLEVGAGVGNHTSFFLDRGCEVVSTDSREENLRILLSRYPDVEIRRLDLDEPDSSFEETFDIVYCYGLLYHLKHPAEAIEFMSRRCRSMLLLETCVSFDQSERINPCREDKHNPTQATSGYGCRPSRWWVYSQLREHFEFVYLPITQPNHEEFPIDWSFPLSSAGLSRAVFIASRKKLENTLLTEEIPMRQTRH